MTMPYKYRGVTLLALLAVVLPFAAWRYALRDTAIAWIECRRIASQLEQLPEANTPPLPIRTDDAEMILSGALLDVVRRAAEKNGVQATGYEPLVTLQQHKTAVHTAQLTLSGDYAGLLRVVDRIEEDLPQCRLRSLVWQAATDRMTRRAQLTLTLYVQQLIIRD